MPRAAFPVVPGLSDHEKGRQRRLVFSAAFARRSLVKTFPTLALLGLLAASTAHAEEAPGSPGAAPPAPAIPDDVGPPQTTSSGLVYSVLKAGPPEGRKPKPGDVIVAHYTGYVRDGEKVKVFDSSRERGEPLEMAVGQFIPGWNEALQLMTPGSRWKLTIPPALAYKDQAIPGIPANSTLVFDMELIGVRSVPVFEFRAGNPANQTTTASGVRIETMTKGEGRLATPEDLVEVAYAIWNQKGKKLASSTGPQSGPIKGSPADVNRSLTFFQEAVLQMNVGTRLRLEVPATVYDPALFQSPDAPLGSPTIWELELVDVRPAPAVPTFALSEPGTATKTASGLEIEMLVEGTGKSPRMHEPVTVHYAGWLKKNGTLFDSSYRGGKPLTRPVGTLIQGWNEALLLMKEGGKARLTIPAALAYGATGTPARPGQPQTIGPNEDLVFVVELLKVGR
jgi:FKBP-type peptidyl-prolyl cis-trans isomerase